MVSLLSEVFFFLSYSRPLHVVLQPCLNAIHPISLFPLKGTSSILFLAPNSSTPGLDIIYPTGLLKSSQRFHALAISAPFFLRDLLFLSPSMTPLLSGAGLSACSLLGCSWPSDCRHVKHCRK